MITNIDENHINTPRMESRKIQFPIPSSWLPLAHRDLPIFRLCNGSFSSLTPSITALQRCAIPMADIQLDDAASVHSRNSRRERRQNQCCMSFLPSRYSVPLTDIGGVVSPIHLPWHLYWKCRLALVLEEIPSGPIYVTPSTDIRYS